MDPDPSQIVQPGVEKEVGRDTEIQTNKKVAYYYDHDVGNFNFGLGHFMKPTRMRMVHDLVTQYDLLDRMDVFRPRRATNDQLTRFHSDEYVEFLEAVTPETVELLTGHGDRFLTGPDCPAFDGLYEFCTVSAGGSICAAERLNAGAADISINWSGGLHHAKKREASGFCYVNDIVLGILELLRYHPRVLYIDIDVHHGDGVEEAFYSTDRVMTASFHKFGDFFPGTGDVRDTGVGKGKNYAVNVPLRDGITDESYKSIFQPIIQHIMDWYRPGAVVLQCGADSLAGDKLGPFNLTHRGHAACVEFVSSFNIPMMVLGGGGYTTKNVARAWTFETGLLLGEKLPEDLPYNHYMEYYGPRFKLEVLESNMPNYNETEYLNNIKSRVIDTLRSMPFAPATGMQPVPFISVGRATGHFADLVGDGDHDSSEDEYDSDTEIQIKLRLRGLVNSNSSNTTSRHQSRSARDSSANSSESESDSAGRHSSRHGRNRQRKKAKNHDLESSATSDVSRKMEALLAERQLKATTEGGQGVDGGFFGGMFGFSSGMGSDRSSAVQGKRRKRTFFRVEEEKGRRE